jgi:hypothetical protein
MNNELKFFLKFMGDNKSAMLSAEGLKSALVNLAKQAAAVAAGFTYEDTFKIPKRDAQVLVNTALRLRHRMNFTFK